MALNQTNDPPIFEQARVIGHHPTVFKVLRYRAPVSQEVRWQALRWWIATETGWALEYIDSLCFEDLWAYLSVQDGKTRAKESFARKQNHAERRIRRG